MLPIADIIEINDSILEETRKAIEDSRKQVIFDKHKVRDLKPLFVSKNIKDRKLFSTPLHVDISFVHNDVLNIEAFKKWRPEYQNVEFILEDGKYICGWEIEKMSKSKHNVQNPDELIEKYGADTLRMYEMFLGPVEQSKPWDTNGIEGVSRFFRKFWRLFYPSDKGFLVKNAPPTEKEQTIINKAIDKIEKDIERFSFNTAVSTFMICVNELTEIKSNNREVLEKLVIAMAPFAPHICEELWEKLGHSGGISKTVFPPVDEQYLKEESVEYPISFNGKMRFKVSLPAGMDKKAIEEEVLKNEKTRKWMEGKNLIKTIVVPGKIVNIVIR